MLVGKLSYIYINSSTLKISIINYNIHFIYNPVNNQNKKSKDRCKNKHNEIEYIYCINEFLGFSKYLQDLSTHLEKGLQINDHANIQKYFSIYFYLLMHLSNLWRKDDISNFPVIEISDLLNQFNIHSLAWFSQNTLSEAQSKEIVKRLQNSKYVISKTKYEHKVFCPKSQEKLIATCYAILYLCVNYCSEELILNTGHKYNNIPPNLANSFLRDYDESFNFTSLKMNRTVATYITYLQEMIGETKDITYAKYLRGHVETSSTLHYVKISTKDVEKLSGLLFERGEFGYITDYLLEMTNGTKYLSFEERTQQIRTLHNIIGDSNKMNYLVSFVNNISLERNDIINELSTLSAEKAAQKLYNIYVNNLPCKDDVHMQCYHGNENCKFPEKDCVCCKYSIPSTYALQYICNKIKNDLSMYGNSPNRHIKNKLANSISRSVYLMNEAIQKFGADYVYSCLNMTREELIYKVSQIERFES